MLSPALVFFGAFAGLVKVFKIVCYMLFFVSEGPVIKIPSSVYVLYSSPLQPLALFLASHIVFGVILAFLAASLVCLQLFYVCLFYSVS